MPLNTLPHAQLQVHLDHIKHNLDYFRSLLKPATKLMALVKANAYGHGATGLSLALERLKLADCLGVAFPCEGIELRKAGVTLPITVLTPGSGAFADLLEHQLEPEILTFETLSEYTRAAKAKGIQKAPFHLALDTGMHRVGFEQAQIPALIKELLANPYIAPRSVFSHLAAADEAQHDAFTQSQIDLLLQMSDQICSALPYPVMRHILNSAGTERFSQAQLDMVRIGIGMYGFSAVDPTLLRYPSSLKSPIIQIKEVPFGDTIGYGRHGKTPDGPKRIATIPLGYADGIDRRLSRGNIHFSLKGVLVPTIGNICMDVCMIDITGVNAKVGDTVTLFGNAPTAIQWAEKLDTTTYEIYTSVSQRVERVYL